MAVQPMTGSDELIQFLAELELDKPHLVTEICVALAAQKTLDDAIPHNLATWGLDRWGLVNQRQKESIDRILGLWKGQNRLIIELERQLDAGATPQENIPR